MNTLRDRTKTFALRVIGVYAALPKTELARTEATRGSDVGSKWNPVDSCDLSSNG